MGEMMRWFLFGDVGGFVVVLRGGLSFFPDFDSL